jgi:hypothetical protein
LFQQAVVLTLRSSLKSIFLSLWDEEKGCLVSFHQASSIPLTQSADADAAKPDLHTAGTNVAFLREQPTQSDADED